MQRIVPIGHAIAKRGPRINQRDDLNSQLRSSLITGWSGIVILRVLPKDLARDTGAISFGYPQDDGSPYSPVELDAVLYFASSASTAFTSSSLDGVTFERKRSTMWP